MSGFWFYFIITLELNSQILTLYNLVEGDLWRLVVLNLSSFDDVHVCANLIAPNSTMNQCSEIAQTDLPSQFAKNDFKIAESI